MPVSLEGKKLIPIRILQILEEKTDFNHPLQQEEIRKILSDEYSLEVERKAVARNLQLLQDMFEIDEEFKDVTATILTRDERGWYFDKRLFEDSELRLLIDGVLASKYITKKYSKDLIEKLCTLSNKYFKSRVKHIAALQNLDKTDSSALFYNIDVIDEAISEKKQISFNYNKYGVDKKLHPTALHKGSPYQLILKNQKYYLLYGGGHQDAYYLRVDKITNIKITDDTIEPIKKYPGFERDNIDYKKINCSLPYMFSGQVERVSFVADKSIIDYIIDDFGKDIRIKELDNGKLEVVVSANQRAMEYWAMQYLKYVEIIEPADLRDRIKENIKNATKIYK